MSTVIDELIVLLELDPSQFTEGQRTALASFRQTQEQAVSTAKVIEAQEIPALINRLRDVAAESGTEVLDKHSVLSAYAILAQTRSVAVDLMIVCGMSRESAVAQLKPTSKHPAFPPEV